MILTQIYRMVFNEKITIEVVPRNISDAFISREFKRMLIHIIESWGVDNSFSRLGLR